MEIVRCIAGAPVQPRSGIDRGVAALVSVLTKWRVPTPAHDPTVDALARQCATVIVLAESPEELLAEVAQWVARYAGDGVVDARATVIALELLRGWEMAVGGAS